jgi:DNA-directed RNA polymerase specialized sigma subunit
MDYDAAKKYMEEHLYREFLPHIDYHARRIASSNPHKFDSQDKDAHTELYHAGLMGLIAAVKNWDPQKAKARGNSFITHAQNSIEGHMRDMVSGIHSFGRQGSLHPNVEKESRQHQRLAELRAKQPEVAQPSSDEPPPIPTEAKIPGRQS